MVVRCGRGGSTSGACGCTPSEAVRPALSALCVAAVSAAPTGIARRTTSPSSRRIDRNGRRRSATWLPWTKRCSLSSRRDGFRTRRGWTRGGVGGSTTSGGRGIPRGYPCAGALKTDSCFTRRSCGRGLDKDDTPVEGFPPLPIQRRIEQRRGSMPERRERAPIRPLLGSAAMRPTEARSSRKASRTIAVTGSIVGVLAMSLVASIRASPLTPLQPPGYRALGPFAATARALGLDGFGTTGAGALGVAAVLIAVGTFLYALRAAWRGELPLRWVLILGIAFHVAVVFLPLLLSRDVYSYAFYGRISSLHGANPYVATPVDFRGDRLFPLIGPQWRATPDVYGPLFTLLAIGLTKVFGRIGDLITAYQAIAAAAGIALMLIVAKVAEELRPARAAFAVALIGLNPVVLFYAVASGHND